MGAQACRLPAPKPLKQTPKTLTTLKTLKTLQRRLGPDPLLFCRLPAPKPLKPCQPLNPNAV